MFCKKHNFCMTGKKKEVLMWNTKNNILRCFKEFPQRFRKIYDIDEELFSDSILFENQLFLIPSYANMIVKFDIDKSIMEEIFIPVEEEDEDTLRKKGDFFIRNIIWLNVWMKIFSLFQVKQKTFIY